MVHAGSLESTKKRVRVARGDSRSNSNLLSAREISQMYDNSIQCNSAQLKALTNCFITLPVEMCIQTDAKTCAKRNTGDAISSARHWILCNVTEFDFAALLAML